MTSTHIDYTGFTHNNSPTYPARYDEGLRTLHRSGTEHSGLTNHAPMVLEAMAHWAHLISEPAAAQAQAEFQSSYVPELSPKPETAALIRDNSGAAVPPALGDRDQ